MNTDVENLFKDKVIGHPAGLFVLFFTEMWERFSFYGMRILLVLFLTAPILSDNPGWEWPREHALALIGTYASLLYLTPIIGGWVADKITGYRVAVVIGCLIMTLGHASMAFETTTSFYIGLALLVVGTGFFKPNITSIISEMYKGKESKKDGAYTIFYMGVNAGAFFGMMLCGYLAENYGWSWGFGLAGIFMLLGMLQFWLAKDLFGNVGGKPSIKHVVEIPQNINEEAPKEQEEPDADEKLNPFTMFDKILVVLSSLGGLIYLFNDPLEKIDGSSLVPFTVGNLSGSNFVVLCALALFLILLVTRIARYLPIVRDRIIAVSIFGVFTVFFFAFFEQSLGSMTLFARDYTDRTLVGSSAMIFKVVDALLTTVPLMIITWVLWLLAKKTFSRIGLSNVILALAFAGLWFLVIFRLMDKFSQEGNEIEATWFGILNSFFIITLAPLFSRWWESKYNPSAAMKYGLGLILLGLGFAILSYGASEIPSGAKTASVSIIFLILAYLLHTMGELCISPVGLSYLSKLVPARMIGFMFGVWYLAIAVGQKAAGTMGGMIDKISEQYSLGTFFLIFTLIPIGVGIISIILNPLLKRLMHNVR
ncbi:MULTISPECIES: peptide MFS transporter [Xanthomarina]|jgi:POT family proton-dependent oligopeptide transporter|uniref:Di-/tripeptide transporter n=3 Tax=Xanthomarina gelatinilytica TaxID=1137281 RepID=M7MKZ8_9FLAO|nr:MULTISPECIES: peptide MFS transporter [Xanthomarina]MCB0388510.1 peptide MFS transporter [Winogradskyella sp.]EMQ95570.1 Di-/tripeptide transporter [Xanthomarina gelatinilytica]MAL23174.1 MFS transporter [Xanthomarina sp.]MBF60619.1 MFS transporter [Xanthomarina sp.]MDX1316500.1 peptide MFS transporter [Xanthomarina gelatinilytica]|tara:strand:+ start:4427 stop:6211 length:1785 start_codon:yes stop_codon:yes gene_type:complete